MMKRTILSCLFSCLFFCTHAQTASGYMNLAPEFPQIISPEAASFNKYINHPVSNYNGTPDINVPLFTLRDGNIELPIALRYNASGIKANEESGYVGLGWNLNVGGMITMNRVGEYDETDTYYDEAVKKLHIPDNVLYYTQLAYTESMNSMFTSEHLWNQFNKIGKFNPDVYYYNYPGGNGKFVYDYRNGKILILNREENIRIAADGTGKFTVTLPDGTIHRFVEAGSMFSVAPSSLVSRQFMLAETEYPDKQKVIYTYGRCEVNQYVPTAFFRTNYNATGGAVSWNYADEHSYDQYRGQECYLSSISTPHYTISFDATRREDIKDGKKLSGITIASRTGISTDKTFKFAYSYFDSGEFSETWYAPHEATSMKRLKLDAVYEASGSQQTDRYEFFYEGVPPHKYSYAIDYWGYYNGRKSNAYLLPDLHKSAFGQHLSLGVPYEDLIDIYKDRNFGQYADRSYSFTDCKAGMLSGITYPTGGYVAYTYEPNSFMIESLTPETPHTLKAIDQNHTAVYSGVEEFRLKERTAIELSLIVNKGIDTWTHFRQKGDTKDTIVRLGGGSPSTGTTVYSYNFGSDCADAERTNLSGNITRKEKITLDSHAPNGDVYTYRLTVDIPDALGDQFGASTLHSSIEGTITYVDPRHKGQIEMYGCGIRIKEVSSYARKGDATPLFSTSYEYNDPSTGKSSGILHEMVSFIKTYPNVYYLFKNSIGDKYLLKTNSLEITGGNTISNPYGDCGSVGYSYVKEMKKSAGQQAGHTIYAYKNASPMYAIHSVRLDEPGNGKLLSKRMLDAAGVTVESETYAYNIKKTCSYYGINFLDRLNLLPDIFSPSSQWYPLNPQAVNDFYQDRILIIQHQLNAYDVTLARKSITRSGVYHSEDYIYDENTLQLKQRDLSMSGKTPLTFTYLYPNDYNWEPYLSMSSTNRIATPVEEKAFFAGNLMDSKLTEYRKDGKTGLISPYRLYRSNITGRIGNPVGYTSSGASASVYRPYADVVYDRYDAVGNVTSVSADGLHTVYLWAYNSQFPVVKIEGATYEQVEQWLGSSAISSLAVNSTTVSNALISIRETLKGKNVLITTYDYRPLAGITKVTDPNGNVTVYDYDSFNRMIRKKDHTGKVIEQHDYNYKH